MPYPQAFFDIQLAFARKMARLSGLPYQEAILHQTALYRILGLDWSLDPQNPVWQQLLEAIAAEDDDAATVYRLYSERAAQGLIPEHDPSPHWGCFFL